VRSLNNIVSASLLTSSFAVLSSSPFHIISHRYTRLRLAYFHRSANVCTGAQSALSYSTILERREIPCEIHDEPTESKSTLFLLFFLVFTFFYQDIHKYYYYFYDNALLHARRNTHYWYRQFTSKCSSIFSGRPSCHPLATHQNRTDSKALKKNFFIGRKKIQPHKKIMLTRMKERFPVVFFESAFGRRKAKIRKSLSLVLWLSKL
jgi:hypothetical protein